MEQSVKNVISHLLRCWIHLAAGTVEGWVPGVRLFTFCDGCLSAVTPVNQKPRALHHKSLYACVCVCHWHISESVSIEWATVDSKEIQENPSCSIQWSCDGHSPCCFNGMKTTASGPALKTRQMFTTAPFINIPNLPCWQFYRANPEQKHPAWGLWQVPSYTVTRQDKSWNLNDCNLSILLASIWVNAVVISDWKKYCFTAQLLPIKTYILIYSIMGPIMFFPVHA